MSHDPMMGFIVVTLVVIGALLWQSGRPDYPMTVCPTCDGSGREYEGDSKHFRVCLQCGGNKSVPR
ncbi:MAG: hypothetical protein U0Q19_22080 [Kineosporiaceae bacterium]